MWIYTQQGFYSIVEDRDDPDMLLVRARVKGDSERLWPKAKVSEGEGSDYSFRARILRNAVAKVLSQEIKSVDYDNFKDRIDHTDPERGYWYHRIWTLMCCLQAAVRESAKF